MDGEYNNRRYMKSKFLSLLILIMIGILVAFGLYREYAEKAKMKIDMEGALFDKEDFPRIDASIQAQPLMNAFYRNFLEIKDSGEKYKVYTDTHSAYERLAHGHFIYYGIDYLNLDTIVATLPSEYELYLAEINLVELEFTPFAKEGFVFIVNKDNPIDSLTIEQKE